MKLFFVLVALVAIAMPAMGKVHDRCSLAKEMLKLGVPKADLSHWACIAEHESEFNTATSRRLGASTAYGIFQINDQDWCKPSTGTSLNKCKIDCSSLVTDDISASVQCALKIKKDRGFAAWPTWKHCSFSMPSIDDCLQ